MAGRRTLIWALALSMPLAGCIDSIRGDDDELGTASGGEGSLALLLNADNVPDDLTYYAIEVAAVLVHDADVEAPDGYYELDVDTAQASIVNDGSAARVSLASGAVPAGSYDQVLIRVTNLEAHGGSGADLDGLDLPINVGFAVKRDTPMAIEIVLDGSRDPVSELSQLVQRVVISEDGDVIATKTGVTVATEGSGPGGPVARSPPAARISIFGPDGALAYKASFLAPDDEFANDESSAFPSGEDVSFSGAASEPVEPGATLSTYTWDFDDGETATGQAVRHAFVAPGVYEVKLTVTDSFGTRDAQVVRVIILGWTTTLAASDFTEAPEGWTAATGDPLGLTTWEIAEGGRNGTAYHVAWRDGPLPYSPLAEAALTSPEFEIPADWLSAGVQFYISGYSANGGELASIASDDLTVTYTVSGEEEPVEMGAFNGEVGWTKLGSLNSLSALLGKKVQFQLTFSVGNVVPTGTGWFLDDFSIGGIEPSRLHKGELLEEVPGHGGPGHQH